MSSFTGPYFDAEHERLCKRVIAARHDPDLSVRRCEDERDAYVTKLLRGEVTDDRSQAA